MLLVKIIWSAQFVPMKSVTLQILTEGLDVNINEEKAKWRKTNHTFLCSLYIVEVLSRFIVYASFVCL